MLCSSKGLCSIDNAKSDYVYVVVKDRLNSWADGARIVQNLSEMLNLTNYLVDMKIYRFEVSFQVDKNPEDKTAPYVVNIINDDALRNNLNNTMGVIIIEAGLGEREYMPVSEHQRTNEAPSWIERAKQIIFNSTKSKAAIAVILTAAFLLFLFVSMTCCYAFGRKEAKQKRNNHVQRISI